MDGVAGTDVRRRQHVRVHAKCDAVPQLLLALVVITLLGCDTQNAIWVLGIGGIPYYARLVRARVWSAGPPMSRRRPLLVCPDSAWLSGRCGRTLRREEWTMSTPAIEVRSLSVTFGSGRLAKQVVCDVSFTVEAGEGSTVTANN